MVDKLSAVIPGRPHAVLNLDHMELNKFNSEDDQNYQKVCEVIQHMVNQKTYSLPFNPNDELHDTLEGKPGQGLDSRRYSH